MYNCPGPVSGVWLSLPPTGVGDSLGHQGCEFSLWNSVTVRGLTAAPGWKGNGAETSQGARQGGGSQGCRRRCPGQGCDLPAQGYGRTGSCCVSITLCPRGKGWMLGEAPWAGVGCSLWHSGLMEKCLFPPLLKRAALIEGEGCPSWCCLKGSLKHSSDVSSSPGSSTSP